MEWLRCGFAGCVWREEQLWLLTSECFAAYGLRLRLWALRIQDVGPMRLDYSGHGAGFLIPMHLLLPFDQWRGMLCADCVETCFSKQTDRRWGRNNSSERFMLRFRVSASEQHKPRQANKTPRLPTIQCLNKPVLGIMFSQMALWVIGGRLWREQGASVRDGFHGFLFKPQ